MNRWIIESAVSLVAGILFGAGMIISGMVDPTKVIGFLDITGDWDPSLAFVMGGALMVFAPFYQLFIKGRKQAVNGDPIDLVTNTKVDSKLVVGSSVFGIGWGIAGICPGPAITSLSSGSMEIVVFIMMMLVGMTIAKHVSIPFQRGQSSVSRV
ncbi:DUF6691 family protein [Vibrio profundi]|uniref:DUF6691 family protein n=1 Tax=Vibrio profundi TaxID=1774960 RepID=UPI003734ED4D